MASKARLLQISRKTHLYFGVFISPALLFFAITGALQTLGLHEAAGTSYKPSALLATLGQIHKKQTWKIPVRRPPFQEAPRVPAGQGSGENLPGPEQQHARHNPAGRGDHASAPPSTSGSPSADVERRTSAASPGTGGGSVAQTGPGAFDGPSRPTTLGSKLRQHLPLKLFFVLVSLGLCMSTITGMYMAYKYDRNKWLITLLLILGTVLPLVLLPF